MKTRYLTKTYSIADYDTDRHPKHYEVSWSNPFYSYLKTCQTIGSFWLTCWSTKGTRKFKKVLKKACYLLQRCYTSGSSQGTVP